MLFLDDIVRVLGFTGMSLLEVLRLDIVSFGSICDSIERIKAQERIDMYNVVGLAFNGSEDDSTLKEWQRIAHNVQSNDRDAFHRAMGFGF